MNGLRKFVMAMYFGTAVFVLCYTGHMQSSHTVAAISILAALYKAANVTDKRLGGAG